MFNLSDVILYHTCPVYANSRACFKPRLVTPCKFTSSAPLSTIQRLNIAWGGKERETENYGTEKAREQAKVLERIGKKQVYKWKMDFGCWITSTKFHSREPLQITSLSNQVHANSTAHFTHRACFNPTAVLRGDCVQAHARNSFSRSWGATAIMKCAALPNILANRTWKGAPLSPNFSFFLPHLNDIPHFFYLPHFTHSIPGVLKMWPLGWQHLYHPGNC